MYCSPGFTSAISFDQQGLDVPLRDAINEGRVCGPRLAASDRDLGSTGVTPMEPLAVMILENY